MRVAGSNDLALGQRVAYNGKMGRLPEPPDLTITTRMIHDHISNPYVKQDRETQANLWATVWLMQ